MTSINYAFEFGFDSVAAVVLAALYLLLLIWFIRQLIKRTSYVYIALVLFCTMRIAAYIMRAMLAGSIAQGSNLGLFITDQILFGIGFFALLYSAFNLVLDRDLIAGGKPVQLFSVNVLRNRHLFRLALMAAVALGIIGTIRSTSSDAKMVSNGQTLHKISTIIFLALTILQGLQTAIFFTDDRYPKYLERRLGDRYGSYLLFLISTFLLVREIFLAATMNSPDTQNAEYLWYPLVALPELLAVICYGFPGLVPTRSAIKTRESFFPRGLISNRTAIQA
ncbi:hypothetical protein C8J57DRAFT_1458358 [Mycena rebaudengoi]|nr:hypothetical protein C8J57DRAFT_1458358 [Mycena rebaudengoi]